MKLHLPVFLRKAILTLMLAYGVPAVHAADLTLGAADSLSVDYSVSGSLLDLNNGTLRLSGGTTLQLSSCGEGDGKTYTLLTGVSELLDAQGNVISLDSTNNAASRYFDATHPGSGFWADGTLQLNHGALQLVLHNETVKDAITITTRQVKPSAYQYYAGVSFENIEYAVGSYAYGGAIYGLYGSITLSGNGSVTFSGNTAFSAASSAYGGAIYGESYSTITLNDNGSVTFSGNTAFSAASSAYGGAIYGYGDSTITLSNNGSVSFIGNTSSSSSSSSYAYGGAICGYDGSTITLSDNGSVTFSGNTASSSSSYYSPSGGAIYGGRDSTITLSNNGSVSFSGNTASGRSAHGGAIYGYDGSTITLSNNGSVSFIGNTASSYSSFSSSGGAIYTSGDLSIRNNDSVEFYQNAEVVNGNTYRLRSIYAGGSGDVISLSAAAGKSITFRDSIYIGSGSTFKLNEAYEGQAQLGDIIFTGATTVDDLYTVKDNVAGTEEEIRLSRTSEVYTLTNLYGGRLRVEDEAIYQGRGITAREGSGATVRVQNATLSHSGYDLTFNAGTTLELAGNNTIAGALQMLGSSSLVFDNTHGNGTTDIIGSLGLGHGADVSFVLGKQAYGSNEVLLYVSDAVSGWDAAHLMVQGNSYTADSFTWVDNLLVLNYDESCFNRYFNGSANYNERHEGYVIRHHYESIAFTTETSSSLGGAIYGARSAVILLSDNGSVTFSGNTASGSSYAEGGAIYGEWYSIITLSDNGSVSFSGNTASASSYAYGGAIYGYYISTITLSDNGNVSFSGNTASGSSSAYGGAIYGGPYSTITLSDNGSVSFSGNTASASPSSAYYYAGGGAIYGYDGSTITLSNNGSVTFSGNTASASTTTTSSSDSYASGGAIYTEGDLSIRNNDSVEFYQNAEVVNGNTYRLRSIYAYGGSGDEISLSAAAGKSITFRDSIYIGEGSSFKLNEAYEGKAQQGDIIFTGATTVDDLYTVKGNVAGTEEEIRLSRTTEVKTLTNLYGGRLRIEAGAIYKGSGMAVAENSGASVWLRNAQMLHQGHNISFGKGTTFGLRGCNVSQSDNLFLEAGSSLSFDIAADNISTVVLTHTGALTLGGSVTLNIGTADSNLAHGRYKLLQVTDLSSLENWSNENLKMGDGSYTISDIEWVDNTLCFNYSGQKLSDLPILPEIPESEIPDTPVTPDEPEIPDTPEIPDEPEIPDTPVTPDEPEIPDTPEIPDEPEIPDTPEIPDEPEIPDTPEIPDEPEIPDTPEIPDESEIPDTPEIPDEPEIPDTPVTPDEPEPLKPFRPGDSALVSSEIDKTMEVILNGKGTITLVGKVNAGAITVNIDKNLTFKSDKKKGGSLVGDGDLTKKGKGTLTLNDGNGSWKGDTYLEAGTIKVKGTTSLGRGDVYVKGGTLNLGSKAIANDIIQSGSAAIKGGKKFTGTYTLESGELLKGSTLNINRKATLAGGTVNGTLSGNGTTTVTGTVKLGDKGKITTRSLILDGGARLTTSPKGMTSKTTAIRVEADATLVLGGKLNAASLHVDGGTVKSYASKPAAITLKNDMVLTDADLSTNGKVTTNKLTLNDSTMSIKGAKAQNLTVKQNLTIGSGSALTLNGKLSAGSLTIKKDGMLTMTGSKPVTLKVKGALTLNSGSSIILNYNFVQGKTYKILTFGSLVGVSGVETLHEFFGVDDENCVFENTGKAITLTVTGKWKPQTQQKAVSAAATEPVVTTKSQANPVADALVQANWGQLEASRAFVNAMANRSMAVQLGNGERAVWASAIGSSSRHDTASGHNGADTNVSGGAFGLETQVGRASLFGMALGNSWTRVSAHGFGTIEQDTTHLGLYGQTNWRSGVTADWSAAYGRSESESMGSDWTQKHLQLDGRVSYNHELNARTVLSPFAGVQYYASDAAGIGTTDTGSLQNLRAEIGVAASHRTGKLGVFGEIAVHQDLARNNPSVSMEGTRYTGMNPGRTGINFTIGASYDLTDKWSVNASYTGEFVENANAHSANVGASYKF